MATRKKKESVNQPVTGWPKITEGSHLKVIEHENGRRELIWNDEALMRDVNDAINNYVLAQQKPSKTSRKKKV
jgi:hypothetical protein